MLAFVKLLTHRFAMSPALREGRGAIALITFTGR
jgi:hypothetical protein